MGSAVVVVGLAGQVRAFDRLPGAAALHQGGVDDTDRVVPQVDVVGQDPDEPGDLAGQGPESLVVAGQFRNQWEQIPQVGAGVADPAGFLPVAPQHPQDSKGDQLGVADFGDQTYRRPVPAVPR